jgi:hypothetical protein
MTSFPGSPRTLKGGIVLIDPATGRRRRLIVLQYNPESLTRSLQVQGAGDGGDRSEALRLTGPPVETIQVEAAIDAADQLEFPDAGVNRVVVTEGIHPQLAALESLIYPASADVQTNRNLAQAGTLEILPMEAPLSLFVWSSNRVVPVRITEFSVTEEAFDPALNPIRARVSLGMRVLNENDLGFDHRGSGVFNTHHRRKEQLSGLVRNAETNMLGIDGF